MEEKDKLEPDNEEQQKKTSDSDDVQAEDSSPELTEEKNESQTGTEVQDSSSNEDATEESDIPPASEYKEAMEKDEEPAPQKAEPQKAEPQKSEPPKTESEKGEVKEQPSEDQGKTGTEHEGDESHDHENEEELDFEQYEKSELVDYLVKLKDETDFRKIDRVLKEIRPKYDEYFEAEKKEAWEKFKAESDEVVDEADFEFKGDKLDQKFNDYYNLLRTRRNDFFSNLEKQKEDNLKKKQEILDKIRDLVDGEETNVSIKAIKELQDEWKSVGPVPPGQNKTLWANYNALLDRFYDARSIYFELKELDRKKNLKAKLELCERAEALDKEENIKDAIVQLNELHEEFKHIGPVPKEEQEPLWLRFKAASDNIYAKRKEFVEDLKHELQENLEKKVRLAEEVQAYVDFDSERINDWNAKTKEIIEIQKKWESIGGLPREKAKEVNKAFWGNFKKFFNNKNAFFKRLEAKREENLKLKQELAEKAEALKDSKEWDKTAQELKKIQQEWKDIGPVPEKFRNEVYQRFKAACDHFFDQRRSQNSEQNKEFEENYQKKLEICDRMEDIAKSGEIDLDTIYDLVDEYSELGFVPRNVIKKMHNRFDEVCAMLVKHSSLTDEEKEELKINIQVNKLKGSPHGDRKLQRKENAIRRKINSLESDISTWKNNLEFFASSKKADALKDDFNEKIEKATRELEDLKKQLDILHQA